MKSALPLRGRRWIEKARPRLGWRIGIGVVSEGALEEKIVTMMLDESENGRAMLFFAARKGVHDMSDDSRMEDLQRRIRELAYRIWEHEGRPQGENERHWEMARQVIVAEDAERARVAVGRP